MVYIVSLPPRRATLARTSKEDARRFTRFFIPKIVIISGELLICHEEASSTWTFLQDVKMAKPKKLSREELLARKRAAEKVRRDKIKMNAEAYELYKEKERRRYRKRKLDKKLVQIMDMTPRQQRIQRKKWKKNSQSFRERKRQRIQLEQRLAESTPPDTDSDDTQNQPAVHQLSPILPNRVLTRSIGAKVNSDMDRPGTSRECDTPKSEVSSIKRKIRYQVSKKILWYKKKVRDLQKQNEMLRKRAFRIKNMLKNRLSKSPRTKADSMVSDPNQKEEVKKALVFAEVIKDNLNSSYENLKTNNEKKVFKENIDPACKIFKKYKMLKDLQPKIVRKVNVREKSAKKKTRVEEDIKSFFERDDISRMGAGKKECITRNKQKRQKRFLLDSLTNLHKRFLNSHQYVVSYTLFCKNKPFWVVAPTEKDKETCMCKLHENVTLLAHFLWKSKIILEKSSSEVLSGTVCSIYNLNCLERKCSTCSNKVPTVLEFDNTTEILYFMWEPGTKEINTKNGPKTIKITEKRQHKALPKVVLELLFKLLDKFYIHCANILNQYESTTQLKKHMAPNTAIIHMDFSENYSTKYNTEIQALHFGGSRHQISLHTSVVYIIGSNPQSFCTYSDCLRHDAAAVWGHIVPILKYIEQKAPDTHTLHIITDSTCSQYRNKTINFIITKLHWHMNNLKCVTWNYTEAGHGKGAPDGVGATIKRTADQIVRYGRDIPDINTFTIEIKKSVKNVILEYVSEYDIYEKEYFMPSQLLKPFKGMMRVHQIVWNKNRENTLALRRQSCVSELCKDKADICIHGKHIGFYNLPCSSPPVKDKPAETNFPEKEKPVIISNILISKKDPLPHKKTSEATTSFAKSNVVKLHRSNCFMAATYFDLPEELRGKNSIKLDSPLDRDADVNLKFVSNAESPEIQGVILPSNNADSLSRVASDDLYTNFDDVKVPVGLLDAVHAYVDNSDSCFSYDLETIGCISTDTASENTKLPADIILGEAEGSDYPQIDMENRTSPSMLNLSFEDSQNVVKLAQQKDIKIGYWVIISYNVKKSTKNFLGQIINTNSDGTFVAKFLRRLKGTTNTFTWPDNDDEDSINKDSILKILDEPTINRRGQLLFNDIQDIVLE